ncbi:MAG TPA: PD-(D/E)XK nuclease family protein [Tepidisphaeraceae bacterium]|jgi:ATP-dependent helicase/nuclease subunit B
MGVRFVIGRAGSGKTRRCFQHIVQLVRADPWGKPILWIVPKQSTFEAERALTLELRAFARVRIFSFESFGQAVLEECGGAAVPEVTPLGRQMILGWLLRDMADQLQFFGGVARQPGLTSKLDATFIELERGGKTPADLQSQGDQSDDTLTKKIADLKKIYQAYLDFLGQDRLDPHRRLQEVLYRMEGCSLVKDSHLFIDGFLDYRQYERQMIAGMAKSCGELEISVLADPGSAIFTNPHTLPDETDLFHRTEDAYRQLYFALTEANVAIDSPVKLKNSPRFKSPGLGKIERGFLNQHHIEPGESAEFVQCQTRRGEAMAAAATVSELIANGMRYRDVLVLSRDINDYADFLEAAFIEHGIPFFLDRRRTVAHHPLLQLLRGVFSLLLHDWPHEAMMSLIKTGLLNLEHDEADELENYVLLHRIRGRQIWTTEDPWTYRGNRRDDEDDPRRVENEQCARNADRLRKKTTASLSHFAEQMTQPHRTLQQRVRDIFSLFENLHVRDQLTKWMKLSESRGDLDQQSEHGQVWTRLVDLFDEMVQLLGDKPISLDDFAQTLSAGLDSFDLALTPATVDQVLVGQVDRTRSGQHRATILLGMNEGQFPLVATEDSILSDSERAELKNRQLNLQGNSQQKRMNENLLAYIAMTRASERLIMTRAIADQSGRATTPSIYWRMLGNPVGRLFGPNVEDISSSTQAVARLIKWIRGGARSLPLAERIYEWVRQADGNELARLRDIAWAALQYDNTAQISEKTAQQLFGQPLVASVSQLETFAACPFKHFLRYGLSLEMRDDEDPTAMDLGNLYHEALRKIVATTLKEKLDWANIPDQRVHDLVWNCTDEVGKELRQELMISSARNRHLLGWIGRTLEKVTATQRAAARRGEFRPALAEMVFGANSHAPALSLQTPEGNQLELRGKIDRVDLHRTGRAFAVIDYKTSSKRLELDRVWHGLSLQLLIYMLVIYEHGEKLWGKKAETVAGFYVELLRRMESVDDPREEPTIGEEKFDLRHKPRGIVREDYLTSFDSQIAPGKSSDVLPVRIKNDGTLYENCQDVVAAEDLKRLLQYVRQKIAELADRILSGDVRANPYRLGTETPCPTCDFRSVCRFQPGTDRYFHIQRYDRKTILENLPDSSLASGGTP